MNRGPFVALGLTAVFFFLVMAVPSAALAQQQQGLVACTGLDCNFCTLVETANRVINLFFEILIIVAVITIVIAGLRLVTSGGNASAMEQAKKSLTDIIIGFVIILSAWLIVDTVFKVMVTNNDFGPWNEFDANTDCGSIRNQSGQMPGARAPSEAETAASRESVLREELRANNPNVVETFSGQTGTTQHIQFVQRCQSQHGGTPVLRSGTTNVVDCRTSDSSSSGSNNVPGDSNCTGLSCSGA